MNASEITCVVADHGLFLPVARRLARDFKKVFYWTPHEKAFPSVQDMIGDGFPDIERVDSVWEVKDECQLFVFPDVGFSPMQKELLSQGKSVWGARDADRLEISRGKFLKALAATYLPVPVFDAIRGMTALRDHLEPLDDKYVKISRFRGDCETFHYRDWGSDEATLDALAVKLGPWKEEIVFYVLDPIETDIEDGCDAYCIDGKWPSLVIHGMEMKDKAYIGTFQKFDDLPDEVRVVNEAFAPILAQYQYRSFFSTEVRITKDGESYFIDPTCRAGSPPSQIMCEMIGNLGEIIWSGANGELVEPEPVSKFGVQALICAKGDKTAWRTIEFPDELDQWVKFGNCCKIKGRLCFPPDAGRDGNEIGWLVGIGDTMDDAINSLKEHSEELPDGVTCDYSVLADLLKEINEAEGKGMEFSEQPIPEPSSILETKS